MKLKNMPIKMCPVININFASIILFNTPLKELKEMENYFDIRIFDQLRDDTKSESVTGIEKYV